MDRFRFAGSSGQRFTNMMRRIQLHFLLVLLTFAAGVPAQAPQSAQARSEESGLRRHVEYLASDKLEGRRTGQPGATLAAKFIADQFAAIKLKPGSAGDKNKASFLQAFPYVTGVEMAAGGNVFHLDILDANGKRTAEDAVAVPVGFSPNGAVENVPVVFAGYGITSKESNFDDYAGRDVTGKAVLIFDGTPDNDNPHSPFVRFDVRTKALIAKDHGAVGVLLISREDKFDDDKLTRLAYDQSLGEAALPTFVLSRRVLAYFPDARSMANADGSGSPTGAEIAPAGQASLSFKINLVKKHVDAFNVIGILPGTDPHLKNEAIVIGAHYDHLGHGGQGSLAPNSTEIHHGADDNASGTAAVIELARQFARDKNNKRTLIFMCFSGEEEGLLGSNYYVNNPVFPLDKTIAMINMDMIGRLNEDKLTIGGIGTSTEWKDLVGSKNPMVKAQTSPTFKSVPAAVTSQGMAATGSPIVSSTRTTLFNLQLNEDGFGPSDHSSFYSKKIPVLFFFTGTHNDYHKPSDTADKINYSGETDIISYIHEIIRSIDQDPQRPTYTVAKSSMMGGRSGFNISLGTIPNYADATDGLLLDGVRDGSPAAKAGVKAGDKVVKLAGHDVRNVMDYTYILGEMKAGQEYEIEVLRGTEHLTLKITPVKR